MNFRDDARALGIGILVFAAILIVSALLWIVIDPALSQAEQISSNTTDDQNASKAIEERKTIWDNILIYALFIAGVFILARAVFESKRGP